ncbi:NERD domain-containing protein [Chryseomicrobium palamuruense]
MIAIYIHHTTSFISALEIFYAQLPHYHPQKSYIESQLKNIKTGERGESKVFRYLEEVTFKEPPMILRNFIAQVHVRRVIQIDLVIITRRYILLIEVKNIAGHIKFNSVPAQLIRTLPETPPQAFDCPFTQLDRNLNGFSTLFPDLQLPIYTALVWANASATFDFSSQPPHTFITLKRLPLFVQQLEQLPLVLPDNEVKKLQQKIITKTQFFQEVPFSKRYRIERTELLEGLFCPTCHSALKRFVRTWVCKVCNVKAHELIALNILSQFAIHGPVLSISEIRKQLPEIGADAIRKVLLQAGYAAEGNTNARVYRKKIEGGD